MQDLMWYLHGKVTVAWLPRRPRFVTIFNVVLCRTESSLVVRHPRLAIKERPKLVYNCLLNNYTAIIIPACVR
jgi:hypothetical protein